MSDQVNSITTPNSGSSPDTLANMALSMAEIGLFAFGPPGILAAGIIGAFQAFSNSEQSGNTQSLLLQSTVSALGDLITRGAIRDDVAKVDSYMTTYYNSYLPTFAQYADPKDTPPDLYNTEDKTFNHYWAEFENVVTQGLRVPIENLQTSDGGSPDITQIDLQAFMVAANKHLLLYQLYAAYANQSYQANPKNTGTYNPEIMQGLLNTYNSYLTYALSKVNEIEGKIQDRLSKITPVLDGGRQASYSGSLSEGVGSLLSTAIGGLTQGAIGHDPVDEGYLFQDNGTPIVTSGYGDSDSIVDQNDTFYNYYYPQTTILSNVVYFLRLGLFDGRASAVTQAGKDRDTYVSLATESIKDFYFFQDDVKTTIISTIGQWAQTVNAFQKYMKG